MNTFYTFIFVIFFEKPRAFEQNYEAKSVTFVYSVKFDTCFLPSYLDELVVAEVEGEEPDELPEVLRQLRDVVVRQVQVHQVGR